MLGPPVPLDPDAFDDDQRSQRNRLLPSEEEHLAQPPAPEATQPTAATQSVGGSDFGHRSEQRDARGAAALAQDTPARVPSRRPRKRKKNRKRPASDGLPMRGRGIKGLLSVAAWATLFAAFGALAGAQPPQQYAFFQNAGRGTRTYWDEDYLKLALISLAASLVLSVLTLLAPGRSKARHWWSLALAVVTLGAYGAWRLL